MLNRLKKKISSGAFSHFFHFFFVFTAIFVVMTIIILQIMNYGLYNTVNQSLRDAKENYTSYVDMALRQEITLTSPDLNSDDDTSESGSDNAEWKITTSDNSKGSAVNVLLYDENGTILNTIDAITRFGNVSLDTSNLEKIVDTEVTSIFGTEEKYRTLTMEVDDDDYPSVKYITFLVSVRQLEEANDRSINITIGVMIVFWIISIIASVYLANWSLKPILEGYEKQKSFVENASHELRTPLAVLQNRLESLFRKPDSTILESTENIAASLDEVRNMRLLTTNLLNLARRDDGLQVNLEDIEPSVFDEIFENYSMIAEESGKTFVGHNEIERTVRLDRTLLKQVMTILFDNALKYTDDDGVVECTVKTTERQLILTVADNGSGVSDDDKKKIFDRFYRVDKARTRQKGGFGLGLSLAQQIVQSLKGTITVRDNHPKGTVFEVKFTRS